MGRLPAGMKEVLDLSSFKRYWGAAVTYLVITYSRILDKGSAAKMSMFHKWLQCCYSMIIRLNLAYRHRSRVPAKRGFGKNLQHERKGVVSRYYQLLAKPALIATCLKEKLCKGDSDDCWWYESGKK
jgi:hypothetical protein